MMELKPKFIKALHEVFGVYKPKKIIETGTYLGHGSTKVLWDCAKKNPPMAQIITIEVNPFRVQSAREYFISNGMSQDIQIWQGLSIERELLPKSGQIVKAVTEARRLGLQVDANEDIAPTFYEQEINFPGEDSLLIKAINYFDKRPDLFLLDSAGHIGFREFIYLHTQTLSNCLIVLDDIVHMKHHNSFKFMQTNPDYDILDYCIEEGTGWCIARYKLHNE